MKFFSITLLLILNSCALHKKPVVKKQVETHEVYLVDQDTENIYSNSYEYRLKNDPCFIQWNVYQSKSKGTYGLNLRYYTPFNKERTCINFQEQVNSHKKILSYIFSKYEISKFTSLRTSSLRAINPSRSWNKEISKLASLNADWLDYTKNYPNHKSKKSSNVILVEIIQSNMSILDELQSLLSPHFKLELKSVEKVFAYRKKALPYDIQNNQISANQRLITDAGVYYFKLIKQ